MLKSQQDNKFNHYTFATISTTVKSVLCDLPMEQRNRIT